MLPQVVLVDGVPKCVIRPTDKKDLDRFVRNGKKWLQAGNEEAKCTYRAARRCRDRHMEETPSRCIRPGAAADETFFGIPMGLPAEAAAPSEPSL